MQHKRTRTTLPFFSSEQWKEEQMRKRWKRRKILLSLLVILVAFLYTVIFIERKIRPILYAVVEYESNRYASISFNQAVKSYLETHPEGYTSLYQMTWDADNIPTAVVADSYQLNLLRTQLVTEVLAALIANKHDIYQFHIGRLTGIQMFAGRGPAIQLKMEPQSYVIADVYHTLETAGENQTLLSVYGTFTVRINVNMAGYIQTVTVENDILLWQNLLLGRVPDVAL